MEEGWGDWKSQRSGRAGVKLSSGHHRTTAHELTAALAPTEDQPKSKSVNILPQSGKSPGAPPLTKELADAQLMVSGEGDSVSLRLWLLGGHYAPTDSLTPRNIKVAQSRPP